PGAGRSQTVGRVGSGHTHRSGNPFPFQAAIDVPGTFRPGKPPYARRIDRIGNGGFFRCAAQGRGGPGDFAAVAARISGRSPDADTIDCRGACRSSLASSRPEINLPGPASPSPSGGT